MEDTQKQIREIQRNKELTSEEKTKKIRDLMQNNNKSQTKNLIKPPSIFNNISNIKCDHYDRGCDIFCSTCNKFYPCRLCHDIYEDHKLDRFSINLIRCRKCKYNQERMHLF